MVYSEFFGQDEECGDYRARHAARGVAKSASFASYERWARLREKSGVGEFLTSAGAIISPIFMARKLLGGRGRGSRFLSDRESS